MSNPSNRNRPTIELKTPPSTYLQRMQTRKIFSPDLDSHTTATELKNTLSTLMPQRTRTSQISLQGLDSHISEASQLYCASSRTKFWKNETLAVDIQYNDNDFGSSIRQRNIAMCYDLERDIVEIRQDLECERYQLSRKDLPSISEHLDKLNQGTNKKSLDSALGKVQDPINTNHEQHLRYQESRDPQTGTGRSDRADTRGFNLFLEQQSMQSLAITLLCGIPT